MKATAQVYSEPLSSPRQKRHYGSRWMAGRPISIADALFIMHLSALCDLIFREERLDPLEGLVDRLCRRHTVVDDIEHRHAPDMLVINLRNGRVEDIVKRHGWVDHALFGIARTVRVRGILPERILGELWHGRQRPAQPRLDIAADDLRLDPVFQELLGHRDVLRSLRDQAAAEADLAHHLFAVISQWK